MSRPTLPRVGAISGVLFVVLLLVSGDGDGTALIVLHLTAFLLFLPFVACLCGVLREAEGGTGWVSGLAFAAAVLGIGVKYGSIAVVIAARDLEEGTPVERAFADVGAAAYMISLLPLALSLGAVAVVALRSHALPRWLADRLCPRRRRARREQHVHRRRVRPRLPALPGLDARREHRARLGRSSRADPPRHLPPPWRPHSQNWPCSRPQGWLVRAKSRPPADRSVVAWKPRRPSGRSVTTTGSPRT